MKRMKVNVVMPMLGGGTRMRNVQPTCKPLMTLPTGERFFMKALTSLENYEIQTLVLVVLEDYVQEFKQLLPEIRNVAHVNQIHLVGHAPTKNPVESFRVGVETLWMVYNRNLPLFCLDCDVYGVVPSHDFIEMESIVNRVGHLFYFESDNPNKSYIQTTVDGNCVTDIAEKQVISNKAIMGAYLFEDLVLLHKILMHSCVHLEYISDIFKEMIKMPNVGVGASPVDKVTNFGTVEELEQYGK